MAILSRLKVSPQQRYDLEDLLAQQSAHRTDAKLWTKSFLSELNLILNGFTVSGVGLNSATVGMTGAALIIPQNSTDFSFFVAAPAEPDVVITDADLVDGVRNYVEVSLLTQDGTPLTKAFWDPEANSGNGQEFNQIVNTITDLSIEFTVSTGGFSGSVNKLPIAIIDTDGSGVIKVILDRRNLFGRLAKPNDLDNEYAWGSKVEPVYQLNMTSVTGTFVAGETVTIGSETATVVTGGTTSITFNEPSGINFANGNSVTGGTSGATGTVNTIVESFLGVDKNLANQKKINDALMTEIKNVKKTRFWWQDAPTLVGVKNELMSVTTGLSGGARVKWDGSKLVITDDNLSPALTDNVAAIRVFNKSANLNLRRQDDGKEVVTVTLSDAPDTGVLTLNQNGNLIAINWNDSAAQIQTTWNGSGAYAATISGSPAAKKITITANAAGLQVDVIQSANTLSKSGSAVTPTITIKQGMASDSSISIADGQILYVDLPEPIVSQNYSGVGSGAGNYKLASRGSPVVLDSTYWLAYREGSKLIWRFAGELAAGESAEISDNIPQSFLDAIGLVSEASLPSYSSDIRGVAQESLVKRLGVLTDAVGDSQEDRSAYFRSDDPVVWTGAQLQFSSNIVLEIINTKSGTLTQHTILAAGSPISLADGQSAWISIKRGIASENVSVTVGALPAQTQANKDIFVLGRRVDAGGSGYLHLPLHKQVLEPGQTVRLGASGSGSAVVQNTAIGFTDGSSDYNCSFSLVSGKTRITLDFEYAVGVRPGTPYGALDVYVNGQLLPRFIDASLTPDGSFTEVSSTILDLDRDYSSENLSVEIIQRSAIIDTSDDNTTEITALNQHKLRNACINSNFSLAQRGSSFASPASNTYTLDRWAHVYDGTSGTFAISRQAFTLGQTDVPEEPKHYVRWDQTVAGAGDTVRKFVQRIEGVRSFAGQTIGVSFWAFADSNRTLSLAARQNFGTSGSPSADVLIASQNFSVTSSWQKFTMFITIPSISGKTLGTDENDFLEIVWNMPLNTTFQFNMAQVMFSLGSVKVAPWCLHGLDAAGELAAAERYLEKSYDIEIDPGSNTEVGIVQVAALTGTAANQIAGPRFRVKKRPSNGVSLTIYSKAGTVNTVSGSGLGDVQTINNIAGTGQSGARALVFVGGIGALDQYNYHYIVDSELY